MSELSERDLKKLLGELRATPDCRMYVAWPDDRALFDAAATAIEQLRRQLGERTARAVANEDSYITIVDEQGAILGCGGGEGIDDAARRVMAELRTLRAAPRLSKEQRAAVEAWRALHPRTQADVMRSCNGAAAREVLRLLAAPAAEPKTEVPPRAVAEPPPPAAEHRCARCHAVMVHDAEVEGREGVEWWCTGCEYAEPAAKPAKCGSETPLGAHR